MKKKGYYIVNIVVLLFTGFFLAQVLLKNTQWLMNNIKITPVFIGSLAGCVIIHLFKGIRLYFLMLEKRPVMDRFLRLYVKTSLVNLVFPFKLGELFRIYSFGYEWNDYKAGLFLILTDRYFDTIPLLLLLLGFTSASEGVLLGIVLILMIFIVIITVVYCIFPSTYKYLNRFLILNSNSERGIKVLDVMKKFRHWYVYVRELVKGRETILLVLSSCAWLMEYGTLYCLIAGTGNIFHSLDFLEYMNSVFMRGTNDYVSQYTAISALVLGGAVACVYGSQFVRGKRCQK